MPYCSCIIAIILRLATVYSVEVTHADDVLENLARKCPLGFNKKKMINQLTEFFHWYFSICELNINNLVALWPELKRWTEILKARKLSTMLVGVYEISCCDDATRMFRNIKANHKLLIFIRMTYQFRSSHHNHFTVI